MTTAAKWSDFGSMDGPKTLAAANQLLPSWVSLLLVVVIAWQLAQLVWLLVPAPAAGNAVATPARVTTTLNPPNNLLALMGTLTVHFVPEPGLLLLLGSGIAGLALIGRHRARR